MASKELIALVAEAIIDNPPIEMMTDDEIIIDWSPTGKAVAATILAALQEPTEAMLDATGSYYIEDKNRDLAAWNSMLAASALGEKSE